MIRALLVLVAFVAVAQAYSTGAGLCTVDPNNIDLRTSMGAETAAQYAAGNRSFTSSGWYTPNGQLTITILCPDTFKGLLIYAVNSAGTKVGSFVQSAYFQVMGAGSQTPSCGGNTTFTHVNANEKANGTTIIFNAPPAGTGTIYFKGMMAHSQNSQWHVINDHVVYELGGSSTGMNAGSIATPVSNIVALAIAFIATIVAIIRW